VLAGCGGRSYVHDTMVVADFRERAETQSDGPITVAAAVPGREETEAIFGVDLYDQGIQPVWLEIGNSGAAQARYAPVSTDRYYFSPLEVAYKNRGGFSDEARTEMERHFDELAVPRYVDPGETRSGFVFTHADSGAKGFNVDLFSSGDSFHFTFLLRVPGFVPDYAKLSPESLYSADEFVNYTDDDLRDALRELPCCSSDEQGEASGEPINVVLVGAGLELLKALLRSGWVETSAEEAAELEPQYLFGRSQDAIFRYQTIDGDSVYEMRFWLTPIMSGQDRAWAGQIRHFYTSGPIKRRFDADVDNARNFALQKFLYGQSLQTMAWLSGEQVVPVTSFWDRLINRPYFTDGYRVVLWLSGEPLSALDINIEDWDAPPGWKR
jgi:hypothetical protein